MIIFQDQVLQVCQALAGFSDGQAEGLRRAMSRKRSREALISYWEAFRDGAAERGVDGETAKKVYLQVIAFSEFGFIVGSGILMSLISMTTVLPAFLRLADEKLGLPRNF